MIAEALNAPANYGGDITGSVKGRALTDPEMWENFSKAARDFKYAETQAGVTATDTGHDLYAMISKMAQEKVCSVGKIFTELDYRAPVVFDPTSAATVDTYFPALDLSALTDSQVIDSTGSSAGLTGGVPYTKLVSAPAVTYLRNFKASIRRGKATEKSAFTLSTFAVSGGTTATLVFAVDTDLTAILAAFNEDAFVAGASADLLTYTQDFTKSWVMNIPSALIVGGTTIPANDYVMTSVTASTRTVVFTIPATTNVGATATAVTCTFYPFRIVGSTTTARIFASQGRVLQGANDGLLENVSGGRRRGRMQGHLTAMSNSATFMIGDGGGAGVNITVGGGNYSKTTPGSPITDGTNGTPRTGPETDVRSTIVHFYFGLGALTA